MEELKKENNIKIKLFGKWFIESTDLEYQIVKYVKDTKSTGYIKRIIGHYSKFESLLGSLPDQFLKRESNAKTVEELLTDVEFIKSIVVEFKNKYTS